MVNTINQKNSFSILHIFSGDLWAGAEVMISNLLRQLCSYPEIRIVALSMNEGILTQKLRDIGIETYIIPESKYSFPQILLKAVRLFKNHTFDVFHCHRYKENLLGLLLSRFIASKVLVSTIHGLSEHDNSRKSSLLTHINFFILKKYFSKTIVVSKDMMHSLLKHIHFTPSKIQIVYNGVDTLNFTNSPKQTSMNTNSKFHIGSVGRMVPIKDYELFLSVASELKNQLSNIYFSILGDGPLKEKLKNKAYELGMNENTIEFLNPVYNPFDYYRSLDLYLNTSIHEGIPLSVLEAMACGVPVIAPQVGGIPEIIIHDKCGFLVHERSPKAFADYCLRLLRDKELLLRFGKEALKRASYFSAPKMAEEYIEVYRKCLTEA